LCAKLRNSGSANFAHAHDCSFSFVTNPAIMAEMAQM
jgi:hypothetical protein